MTWMKTTFNDHCELTALKVSTFSDSPCTISEDTHNRQPFGLYTHPIHVAPNVPGVLTPNSTINMINQFLDWAQVQPDVWIITNYQLVQWMQNPTPISGLNDFAPFKCPVPQVNTQICNGIPADELGLVQNCDFSDFPFGTCVSGFT